MTVSLITKEDLEVYDSILKIINDVIKNCAIIKKYYGLKAILLICF